MTRLVGQTCVVDDCMRPAREYGGYCTRCWMSLSATERNSIRDTEPIDTLELWFQLPARNPHNEWSTMPETPENPSDVQINVDNAPQPEPPDTDNDDDGDDADE